MVDAGLRIRKSLGDEGFGFSCLERMNSAYCSSISRKWPLSKNFGLEFWWRTVSASYAIECWLNSWTTTRFLHTPRSAHISREADARAPFPPLLHRHPLLPPAPPSHVLGGPRGRCLLLVDRFQGRCPQLTPVLVHHHCLPQSFLVIAAILFHLFRGVRTHLVQQLMTDSARGAFELIYTPSQGSRHLKCWRPQIFDPASLDQRAWQHSILIPVDRDNLGQRQPLQNIRHPLSCVSLEPVSTFMAFNASQRGWEMFSFHLRLVFRDAYSEATKTSFFSARDIDLSFSSMMPW